MMAYRNCGTGADTCVLLQSREVSGKTSRAQRSQPCRFLISSLLLLVMCITNSRAADNIIRDIEDNRMVSEQPELT